MYALREHLLLLGGVIAWVCFWAYPELMQDRIDPYDASLFAANGAIFLSAVQELGQLLANPVDWLYTYYDQYPALAVRRHPPLFGITEMLVFLFTGVSVFGAKLTAFGYSLAFAVGIYALSYRIWRDTLLAAATAFLVMATPQVIWLGTAVRLDLPALTFAIWALFHYVGYSRTNQRSSAILFAIFSVLSVYTYQLAVFIIAGACLHLVFMRKASLFKDRTVWIATGILVVLIFPLVIEQLYVAKDNLTAAAGGEIEEWKRFHPIENRLSADFYLFYPVVWLKNYPVQTLGFLVWIYIAVRRGVTQENVLLLLCAACAFIFFTWMRGKEPRYAVYFMIPVAFLAAQGLRDLMVGMTQNFRSAVRHRTAAGLIIALGLGQAYAVASPNFYLSGMDRPTHDIVAATKNTKIFYSGPRDAAFVFYIRQYDQERRAKVYRATVQLRKPEEVAEFIKNENINVIVFEEEDGRLDTDGFGKFRNEIGKFIAETQSFEIFNEYLLYLHGLNGEKKIKLRVFRLNVN